LFTFVCNSAQLISLLQWLVQKTLGVNKPIEEIRRTVFSFSCGWRKNSFLKKLAQLLHYEWIVIPALIGKEVKSMVYETILYEEINSVAKITLNLPEMRNPLTEKSTQELILAIREADRDPNIRAIILTGAGKAFSAGGNLNEFKKNLERTAPELYVEGRESTELFKLGTEVTTPLIACVNGPALGGGTGLVAMCHLAIASTEAKLGLTELRLGLVPFVIMPWVRRAVGERKMMEMMLTAEILSAEQAKDINLVHRVVSPEELEKETMKLARKVASFSPLAVKLSLDAFFNTEQMDMLKSLDYLSTLRLVSFMSEDLKEGASAFLEKRQPAWRGK
jgi:enoyl-CoA hydratase/carnithine racemase